MIEVLALKKPEASEASAKWQYIAIGDIDVYYRVQIQQLIYNSRLKLIRAKKWREREKKEKLKKIIISM